MSFTSYVQNLPKLIREQELRDKKIGYYGGSDPKELIKVMKQNEEIQRRMNDQERKQLNTKIIDINANKYLDNIIKNDPMALVYQKPIVEENIKRIQEGKNLYIPSANDDIINGKIVIGAGIHEKTQGINTSYIALGLVGLLVVATLV